MSTPRWWYYTPRLHSNQTKKNIQEEKSKSIFLASLRWLPTYCGNKAGKKHLRNFAKNSISAPLSSPLENCVKAGCCFWSVKAFLTVPSAEQCQCRVMLQRGEWNDITYLGTYFSDTIYHLIMRPNQPPPSQGGEKLIAFSPVLWGHHSPDLPPWVWFQQSYIIIS